MQSEDLYKLLQVDPQAQLEVIRAAYRALSASSHPDVNSGVDDNNLQRRLNAAMDTLGDERKKAEYDASRSVNATETGRTSGTSSSQRKGNRKGKDPEEVWKPLNIRYRLRNEQWAKTYVDLYENLVQATLTSLDEADKHSPLTPGSDWKAYGARRRQESETAREQYFQQTVKFEEAWAFYRIYVEATIANCDQFLRTLDEELDVWPHMINETQAELKQSLLRSLRSLDI